MGAAAYLRVSAPDQAGEDAYGLDAQNHAIQKYCQEHDIDLVAVYEDTQSGAITDRPGLMALLAECKTGKFTKVLVPKLDRLSRDALYCLWIEKELRKNNVELISAAEPYRWDDPMQKMMLTIMAAFAEYEKELIKIRLCGGRKAKARKGGYSGGRPCIGYKAKSGSKALLLDDAKAKIVKRVFEIRDSHPDLYLKDIARMLNEEGHTPAKGKKFYPMQVQRILKKRPFYKGVYLYAGVQAPGQHPVILAY
ncbi:MAG TPA: recombinase family protein [Syntrophobacteraceae bacterium]|nr:recombinase family protein [Syntrophobacteraceae bacterium]